MRIALVLAVCLLSGCNNMLPRDDWWIGDWSTSSQVAFGVSTACHVVDNLQTQEWLDREPWVDEQGQTHTPQEGFATGIMPGGKYPDESDLWARTAIWTAGTYYAATTVSEKKHDRMWVILALSAPCIVQVFENHQMGIRINFGG